MNIEGIKNPWKIGVNDVVELGDEIYVRLAPQNAGLVALVDPESERKNAAKGRVDWSSLRGCATKRK